MLILLGVLVLIIILLLVDVPIAFAFGAGALLFATLTGRDVAYLVPHAFFQSGAFALLALPLFIISGALMGASGISERLIEFVNAFIGRMKGGLGAVTVVTCALFGAISGSGAAAIAAIGSIMIPRMVKEGYPAGYATALVGCSSVLALLIPPSIPMIIFALTGGLSIAACFLATVIPGVILTVLYCCLNFLFVRKFDSIEVAETLSFGEATRTVARATYRALFALLMPLIVLGGIYSGMFTPTEAAAVAFAYTLPVGFLIYRGLTLRKTASTVVSGVVSTGAIMIILFCLFIMSRTMIMEQVPKQIADALLSIFNNKYALLFVINILLLLIGMIVDDVSGGIVAAIILLPVAIQAGVHPIHFAAIVGTNLGLGNITPPCAPLLYMAGSVAKQPLQAYMWPTLKFLALGHLPVVFLVTYVPDLALYLPRLLLGIK